MTIWGTTTYLQSIHQLPKGAPLSNPRWESGASRYISASSISSRREQLSICLPHGARLATNVEQTPDGSLGLASLGLASLGRTPPYPYHQLPERAPLHSDGGSLREPGEEVVYLLSPDFRLGLLKNRASGTAQPPLRASPLSTSSRREHLSVTPDGSLGLASLGRTPSYPYHQLPKGATLSNPR